MVNIEAKLSDVSVRRATDTKKELILSFDNGRHHALALDTDDDAITVIGKLQNFVNVLRSDVAGGRL